VTDFAGDHEGMNGGHWPLEHANEAGEYKANMQVESFRTFEKICAEEISERYDKEGISREQRCTVSAPRPVRRPQSDHWRGRSLPMEVPGMDYWVWGMGVSRRK
jgi:hypothetical protein